MPSLKEIRTKISSVKSTKRIMQAMKMIATVKYAKTQLMLNSFRPYFKSYEDIVKIVTGSIKDSSSRFLNPNENSDKDILIIVSSDRGLCGSYNTSLFRMIEKHNFKSENIKNLYVGKKGADYFKEVGFGESISSLTEKNYKKTADIIFNESAKRKTFWLDKDVVETEINGKSITTIHEETKFYVEQIYNILKEKNTKFSLAIYPWPQNLINTQNNSFYREEWKKFCQNKCEYFLDYFEDFNYHVENIGFNQVYEKYFFWNDVHFNKEGNLLIANKIIKKLLNNE